MITGYGGNGPRGGDVAIGSATFVLLLGRQRYFPAVRRFRVPKAIHDLSGLLRRDKTTGVLVCGDTVVRLNSGEINNKMSASQTHRGSQRKKQTIVDRIVVATGSILSNISAKVACDRGNFGGASKQTASPRESRLSMKPFLRFLCCFVLLAGTALCQEPAPPGVPPGKAGFDATCALCHGDNGRGGDKGHNITALLNMLSDDQLTTLIHDGLPAKGMPGFPAIQGQDLTQLMAYLHNNIRATTRGPAVQKQTVQMVDGKEITGTPLNLSSEDLQIRTDDGRIHLLRPVGTKFREVTTQADWPSYDGGTAGNRYTAEKQITLQNVSTVGGKWIYSLGGGRGESTPVVVQGIMYVTVGNECIALDAGSGRLLWRWTKPTAGGAAAGGRGGGGGGGGGRGAAAAAPVAAAGGGGLAAAAPAAPAGGGAGAGGGGGGGAAEGGTGINKGAAVSGDSVFMETGDAHMVALNRFTGALLWDSNVGPGYRSNTAAVVAGDVVIGGNVGGDGGARGFLVAFDTKTGKEAWRFWTVPEPGQPGSETWSNDTAWQHGGGVTWVPGSYDAKLGLVYWGTGNPWPDYDASVRPGDNLYTDSIIALDVHTGKLKWYYQATPHDLNDWDATEPLALVDRNWEGAPRKLLLQANRNGFFYVLDRETGKLLLAKPFAKYMNWSKEVDAQGKPVRLPLPAGPAPNSVRLCPAQAGATNWFATTYDPGTGYYLVQRFDICSILTYKPDGSGGSQHLVEDLTPHETLIAIDVATGKTAWELPETGSLSSWGGTLGLASGVLFFCGDAGVLTAVDVKTGKPLWTFQTSTEIHSSPMSYVFDGKQYIAVSVGANVLAFTLPTPPGK